MSEAEQTCARCGAAFESLGTEDSEQIDWQVIAVFPERAAEASEATPPRHPSAP